MRLPTARADDPYRIHARKLATIENRFQNADRFGWDRTQCNLLLGPEQDADAQGIWLHESSHEANLVKADGKEEACELGESFFAQVAPTVQVISASLVAPGEKGFIFCNVPR